MNWKKTLSSLSIAPLIGAGLFGALPVQAANAGDLIKCPEFDSVYYLADDGERYVFQNEKVFYSHYENFDDVAVIACDDLADLPIGGVVFYQAGTKLVKIPSDPTVYVVEENGMLRPLASEEQAVELFGEDWAERVDDLSEAFFGPYEVGEELADGELPEGTVLEDENDNLLRINAEGLAQEIEGIVSADVAALLRDFALSLTEVSDDLEIEIEIETEDELDEATKIEIKIKLEAVEIEDEDEVEIEDIDELGDSQDDANDAISDAQEEIADATTQIAEDSAAGLDVSEREAQLAEAQSSLAEAQAALAAGDYLLAEELADDADDLAHDAREDREDETEDDNEDEDENETHDDTEDTQDDETEDSADDQSDDSSSDDSSDDSETDDSSDDSSSEDSSDSDSGDSDGGDDSSGGGDSGDSGSDD